MNRKNQRGAIAILCLAGILITMMMAWVIFDAGPATREKYQLQSAADAAVYSESAVKARSMNMVIYGNVAKRSIYSITVLYQSMYWGYVLYVIYLWSKCNIYNIPACIKAAKNTALLLVEGFGDYATFRGNKTKHHNMDMLAIDNYQLYTMGITPWWAWTEGAVRGIRNGATASTSFPPPAGLFFTTIPQLLNKVFALLGMGSLYNSSGKVDRFPLKRAKSYGSLKSPTIASIAEIAANTLVHKDESSSNADDSMAIGLGLVWFAGSYLVGGNNGFKDYGRPFEFENYNNLGSYLADTSYISYTYKQNLDRFGKDLKKYNYLKRGYKHQFGTLDDITYKAGGLWAMARSEISYQGPGKPNKWVPSWTARMRPLALPNEWNEAGYDINATYHDIVPYLGLLSVIGGTFSGNSLLGSLKDLALMERNTLGMGQSTIRGIGK